ncbi:MAG: integration host factor [Coriobacteriales bacterium]|jgi:hypothetical protein|nr:integration host factor [Coriobacteriales bacterium]
MPLPQLTPEQRQEALKKAAEARKARSELREKVKTGKLTIAQVLKTEGDKTIDKIKVVTLIQSLPGWGKAKTLKLLEDLDISETRRVKGLGERQREALIEKLG